GPDVFGSCAGGVRLTVDPEAFSSGLRSSGLCSSRLGVRSPALRPQPARWSDPGRNRYPVIGQSVCTQQPRVNDPPLVLSARLEIQQRRSAVLQFVEELQRVFSGRPVLLDRLRQDPAVPLLNDAYS